MLGASLQKRNSCVVRQTVVRLTSGNINNHPSQNTKQTSIQNSIGLKSEDESITEPALPTVDKF